VDKGRFLQESRVVVGLNTHRTPEFSDVMKHLIVIPTWHVPRSIATEEILPELQRDPGYLARKNMRLVPTGGTEAPANASALYWRLFSENDFPFRVKQNPGDDNALGVVKFMFPNQHAIYLHDTPSKSLFAKDARAFSHGCVRVEKPFELAHLLLASQESDPAAAFQRWLGGGRERQVDLAEPVPVHLTYRTAWVDDLGRHNFRSDVYGRDRTVAAALATAGVDVPGA
jgi:murein L,D-transpeptidase YcbB/YkuD